MRVLLLTQYFTPEPADKWQELATLLRDAGHGVEVLTGFPCYPLGTTYPGYRQKLLGEEQIDGVRVIRAPQLPDHSKSALRRILYYCSFAISAILVGLLKSRRPDVILVYQSAAPIGLTAWLLSRLWRRPYVLDVADLWPESVAASGMMSSPLAMGVIRRFMRFVYAGAAEINVITKGYRESLVAMGVHPAKIHLVYYWPSSSRFPTSAAAESPPELTAGLKITYAGAVGPCQGLGVLLDAASLLTDLPEVRFEIIGDGVELEGLRRSAAKRGLANVEFLGRMPLDQTSQRLRRSDLLLIHLKPDPMSRLSIPSKTFACMAAARPLLMAVEGEATDIVASRRCGETAAPSDPRSLEIAIRRHLGRSIEERREMGRNARRAYEAEFCRDAQAPKLIESLERAAHLHRTRRGYFYRTFGKRGLDIAASATLLVLLSPVIAVTALLVRCRLGSPVLFRQDRPGRAERVFRMIKFRSMSDRRDADGVLLDDEQRLPPFGRLLRASSLDELPELWNVLCGDMSLVGPRPLLTRYLPRYSPQQRRRHEVRPGVTGLAQVKGRNACGWEERLKLDVAYVENLSLRLDLWILLQTVVITLTRRGVAADGHATMPEFRGKEDASPPASTDRVAA
ncbi:Undecaprenyl phosphate N,N'-diacetylbacillosamine 1-phosphate transferase [Posidoniimonas polymericola]|uniref:Undecaprenyl phosphate N,N'-diacetylbacillosamine 1-phosphate transferase n=1 Tax=Posidoniimonas polymericola TaxID=2528002 RepID=A0A5C5YSK6_9BACT|nr:sugar transferase [Posidoniimonas polymericola]TWT77781.1 Undecaprenyl phosphate N,N'-diacetylbacillosamine 1-phosphate transferase [Posidoniimonas polymericola]